MRIGSNADFGVDLSSGWVPPGVPVANAMGATINQDTGVLTFPATEGKTLYPGYYNLVVVATTGGVCVGYDGSDAQRQCLVAPGGRPQTAKVSCGARLARENPNP
jgi:hypothetical protein